MSPLLTWITVIALVGTAAIAVLRYLRTRRLRVLLFELAALLLVAVLLWRLFGFPVPARGLVGRGAGDEASLLLVVVLFGSMVLGMLAHWLYRWLEVPAGERPPFDLGAFLAPVLASPIVFIPLLGSLQSADIDLATLDVPRLMLLLVAFENGFFWKEYFDNRRKEAGAPA